MEGLVDVPLQLSKRFYFSVIYWPMLYNEIYIILFNKYYII
jgi:hypothetical protein